MRILALSLLALVVILQFRLWVSGSGMREVWRLRREVAAQQEINEGLKERNRTLAGEVVDLKSGKSAIEERARTDLGMIGTNETFFQLAPTAKKTQQQSSAVDDTSDAASVADQNLMTNHKSSKPANASGFNATQADSH